MGKRKREDQKIAEMSPLSPTNRRRYLSHHENIANSGPVDTPGEINYRYYNHGPVDTDAERNVRYNNPGPVDTVNEHKFKDKMQTIKQDPESKAVLPVPKPEPKPKDPEQKNSNTPTPFSTVPRPR
ncbi:MAG: hypothetical protein CK424_01585 [Legionella sp.]|nr:MAG: hypothetical protein CK424_01585 [Legionella sp.]